MILAIHNGHLIPVDLYADITYGMSTGEWDFWLPANTPEAGAVALKRQPRYIKAAYIFPMHLCGCLAGGYHIHKHRGQVPFDTLFLIPGLLYSIMFRVRSLFERANQRSKARGVVDDIVNRLRVKVCVLYQLQSVSCPSTTYDAS